MYKKNTQDRGRFGLLFYKHAVKSVESQCSSTVYLNSSAHMPRTGSGAPKMDEDLCDI